MNQGELRLREQEIPPISIVETGKKDAFCSGFENVFLSTDHIGFYERCDFEYIRNSETSKPYLVI